LSKPTYIFDIEANGLSLDAKVVHCLCVMDYATKEEWTYTGEAIKDGVARLAGAEMIVAHNGVMYDVRVLERLYKAQLPYCLDTLICSRVLYPDIFNHPIGGNYLEDWGKFLGSPKAAYTGGWDALTPEMIPYCQQDVRVCEKILNYVKDRIAKIKFAIRLEHQVASYIAQQIENGIAFDIDGCEKFQMILLTDMASLEAELQLAFPVIVTERHSTKTGKRLKDDINEFDPNSRKKVAERFIAKYGWKPKTYTEPTDNFPNGQVVINEAVLAKMEYPEARLLERWYLLKKRLEHVEQWLNNYRHHNDGRVHGDVTPLGCVSSRMSHKNPNLAQVTKVQISKQTKKPILGEAGGYGWESRSLFRAGEGLVLVGADLAGLELRCLANRMWRWDDGAYAKVLLEGDIHTANMEAAGLPSRDMAKTFIYAFLYGAGDAKIGRIVGGDAARGKELKAAFLKGLPALGYLLDYVKGRTKKYQYLIGIDGRPIPVRSDHMALNTQLQSDGAIIAKVAFVLANQSLRDKPVKFLLNIHDEFQVECPPDMADEVGKTLVSCMERAGKVLKVQIPITGEYKIGKNWAETH